MAERLVPNRLLRHVIPSRYSPTPRRNLEIFATAVEDDHRTGQEKR